MTEQEQGTETAQRQRVEACLQRLADGFRRRWENNPEFRESLSGKDRDIVIDIQQTGTWWIQVRDGNLQEIVDGDEPEDADVGIEADADDFVDVFEGDLGPVKAYMTGKIKVDAGMRDLMLVKTFLG